MGQFPTNAAILTQQDRLKYPGLLPAETLIFRSWLGLHEAEFDRFDYNERVGPADDPGPNFDAATRLSAIANSRKRVDAVGWNGNIPTLIEVKRRAGASSIGQLLAYYPLWNMEHPQTQAGHMILVTNSIQTGIDISANYHGIRVDVVPVDFSVLARYRRASPFMAPQRSGITYL